MSFEKFKEEKKVEEKKFFRKIEVDVAQTEIKKLYPSDIDIVLPFLIKSGLETNREEILDILKEGASYGAFVDRIIGAVSLAWLAHFDEQNTEVVEGELNSLHIEELIVLFAHESKRLGERLISAEINEARSRNLKYIVSTFDNQNLETRYIRALESHGLRIIRKKSSIIAFKKL